MINGKALLPLNLGPFKGSVELSKGPVAWTVAVYPERGLPGYGAALSLALAFAAAHRDSINNTQGLDQ